MARRVCYIHVGPHKTGTTSIQWFLKEKRADLLKHGYFVPESGTLHGAHHPLVRQLCGQELPKHQQDTVTKFARAIKETACEAIVISSEALEDLLRKRRYAKDFFDRLGEFDLEPTLVFFPRNQSQLINSRYTEVVRGFLCSESFERFVQAETWHPNVRYSDLVALADAFNAKLIARPFTEETLTRGVVPEFLRAIDIESMQFQDTNVRRNKGAGPFTVSVARDVLRSMGSSGQQLKWLQAARCGKRLTAYLDEKGLADTGYCGLTTALAQHIETKCQPDNDAFAQQTWDKTWADVFAADVGREFMPNDFAICPPSSEVERRLVQAVHEMKAIAQETLLDPALAIEAPWNDLGKRSGGFQDNRSSI
jgi:hypothetical protein